MSVLKGDIGKAVRAVVQKKKKYFTLMSVLNIKGEINVRVKCVHQG